MFDCCPKAASSFLKLAKRLRARHIPGESYEGTTDPMVNKIRNRLGVPAKNFLLDLECLVSDMRMSAPFNAHDYDWEGRARLSDLSDKQDSDFEAMLRAFVPKLEAMIEESLRESKASQVRGEAEWAAGTRGGEDYSLSPEQEANYNKVVGNDTLDD
ncbi:hypothetical protein OPIT5_01330 [Opitutaceae bacterium TAV5]|nr:hypothetical protein OPIT5_01330 [Opitutaceae bacterium TAV5]